MANYITNITVDGTKALIKDTETSNNLTEHVNANNPHHISKATIGLEKLQNVEYIPKHVATCPYGDALDNDYWRNLGTGVYFAYGLTNLPVNYAFAIVYIHDDNDVSVILHEQPKGRSFRMSGSSDTNSGWVEFAMKSDVDAKEDKTEIINAVYPVGSIYMSVNSVDPSTLFGGTWSRIEENNLGDTGVNMWKRTA